MPEGISGGGSANNRPPNNGGAPGSGEQNESGGNQGLVFDTWLQEQAEDVRGMLDVRERGLRSALETERASRKELEKQLRGLAGKAEKGSEAERALTEMADRVAGSERRAGFYEEAHAQGITNLRLAFMVAEQDELIDSKGRVSWEQLKKSYPELFGARPGAAPKGNAGSGTQTPPGTASMNDFIRAASGRSPRG